MNKPPRCRTGLACLLLSFALGWAAGCQQPTSELELISYKDPYSPEHYRLELTQCAYRVDAGGNLHIVGRASSDTHEGNPGKVTQFLHARLFWQPKPGRTFANSTTTDATIRYVIITPTGAAVYSGTGFVYPRRQRGEILIADLERACLRLEAQVGDAPAVLGDAHLSGTLVAREDAHAAVDLIRQLEQHAAGSPRP